MRDAANPGVEPQMCLKREAVSRLAAMFADPRLPAAEERETHSKHQIPLRSCCVHCTGETGKEAPRRRQHDIPGVPLFHLKVRFMRDEGRGERLAVLVF